jgi:hypothetical protein
MEQHISKTIDGRLTTARLAAKAAAEYATDVVLQHNTQAMIESDIAAALVARKAVEDGVLERRARQAVLRSIAKTTRGFVMDTRDILRKYLGKKYSPAWTGTGFNSSLEVPRKADKLEPLVDSLHGYLVSHPDYANDKFEVTAERAESLFNDLLNARKNAKTQVAAVETLRKALHAKSDALGERLHALFGELDQLLDPLDSRWVAFGFNKPGAKPTPDLPQNVTAILIGPNAVAVKWNSAARAEHYRVWKRVVGVDEEMVAVGSPADLDFTIEALPGGATIEIAVSAVNNGGESDKSTVVSVVTH